MASYFATQIAPAHCLIFAAADAHYLVHPMARKVMADLGHEFPEKVPLTMDQVQDKAVDMVITLCNKAREVCPTLPGAPARIHWALADPTSDETDEVELSARFARLGNEIKRRVEELFNHGYFQAMMELRNTFGALLDNLTDGVMAHDLDRKIFYFNRAASKITGYEPAEVVGRDCHQVFKGRFCGGNCTFCDVKDAPGEKLRYLIPIHRKNGVKGEVEMSVVPIRHGNGPPEGALVIFRDITEITDLRRIVSGDKGFQGIIGRDPKMVKVFEAIRDLADVDVPVLIQGESGTGKEMVANALHNLSRRGSNPFVPINCGALPEGILESELFGHVRGAFTGAVRNKKGRFEMADTGTLFLDEIGEISMAMQVKLLRVLQEKSFVPVGGEKTVRVNVRVVSASNKDLKELTRREFFREDLYYRLAVIPINLPPLRDRPSDVPLLVDHFLAKMGAECKALSPQISTQAMALLMAYSWPGNVRELRNCVQYALIKSKNNVVDVGHLPPEIREIARVTNLSGPGRKPKLTPEAVKTALAAAGQNKAKAARALGVSRTTLYRYIRENIF